MPSLIRSLNQGHQLEPSSERLIKAGSKMDFIHKIKIAAKEVDETEYWLDICQHAENHVLSIKYHFNNKIIIESSN